MSWSLRSTTAWRSSSASDAPASPDPGRAPGFLCLALRPLLA
jgi:hypothetical protein